VSAVTQIMFYVTNDFNRSIKNDKNKCYNDIINTRFQKQPTPSTIQRVF